MHLSFLPSKKCVRCCLLGNIISLKVVITSSTYDLPPPPPPPPKKRRNWRSALVKLWRNSVQIYRQTCQARFRIVSWAPKGDCIMVDSPLSFTNSDANLHDRKQWNGGYLFWTIGASGPRTGTSGTGKIIERIVAMKEIIRAVPFFIPTVPFFPIV